MFNFSDLRFLLPFLLIIVYNPTMGKYDNAYKYLFKNKRIFYQLITSFVKEDFVKDITLENIELVDKSFVSEEFLARESDVIYKINLPRREVYIFILLEFQSTVDKTVPVRMLSLLRRVPIVGFERCILFIPVLWFSAKGQPKREITCSFPFASL